MPKPSVFVVDVDGVMTDGKFLYSEHGKVFKVFGADDADGLALLRSRLKIHFVSGDKRGFPITRKRIAEDMRYPLDMVSTVNRAKWIAERYPINEVIYMGDGLLDHLVFREVMYGIAPANSSAVAIRFANHVTERSGGDRAVAEACLHILEMFFEPYEPEKDTPEKGIAFGEWTA